MYRIGLCVLALLLVGEASSVVSAQDRNPRNQMQSLDNPAQYSVTALESLAIGNNPTLVQAQTEVTAARGAALQAGLRPNPVVGYTAEQVGVNGTAGEFQGGFVSQEIVRGGKLKWSRAKYTQRIRIAQSYYQAQYQRVSNGVRRHFFHTLASQRQVEVHRELVSNGEDNLQTHREMLNLGQANHPQLLQAEISLRQDELQLQHAEAKFRSDWRRLAAVVGVPLAQGTLTGSLSPVELPLDWESALGQLQSGSPLILAARQKIRHDVIALKRERVEPIPNLLIDFNVGKNTETNDTVAGVSVGIPLPVFDMNRGTIQQACADLRHSRAEVQRLELELQSQLAARFEEYEATWGRIHAFQNTILPKAQQSLEMLQASYKARRLDWPEVLAAQRVLLNLQRQHVMNLVDYRDNDVAIRGLLLTDALAQPNSPVSGGHIDAVSKPR